MSCPSCGFENPSGLEFCGSCGTALARSCPSCGFENPPEFKFCGKCGAKLVDAQAKIPAPEPRAPTSFASGRYRVNRLVGEGAKKRVYLARDERLDRDVALALIKTEGLDEAGRVRVRREAQAMGRLGDHPHIVTVHDIGEDRGQLYIVSQYMAGGDLDARLGEAESRRLPIREVLRIGEELCHALEHAHARGVVHRDLKPGNVWLTGDGSARLGDFGLALALDRSRITQEGMMVGTAAYMPPEQALSGEVGARSDLYALGAVLYEMVTGRPPFLGDDVVAVISQHINTAPVAPSWHNPEIPRALEGLILRLLAKDPSQRPASAAAVREELARAASMGAEVVPAEERAANPLDRLAAGVFVGRDEELGHLRSAFDDSLSGRGRILMLVGEPGIGKTRTAEELATYARLRGAQVLWGRCYEGEGAPAYWPWVQIIRAYVHDREPGTLMSEMGPGAADIAEVVSEVRERLPGLPKPPELEPEQARFRLFDSITTFLKNASQGQPLVLVVDDLHWADQPSLLLLQFLAKELAPSRLLLLGTYRDVELGRQHPLEQTLAELARSELSERVLLRGLGTADVARFIELSAGRTPPQALVEAVYRETEGNPFFVHEVVQLLQSDGRLEGAEAVGSWSLEIPQGVRQVVGRRLSSLTEECNRVLGIASVIGREFELPVLAEVSELAEDAVLGLLEQAEGARIVGDLPATSGSYRFSHALIRETLYEEIRTTRRLRLHHRIAEAIETLYAAKLEPRLAELAYHFCEAASGGDVTKAVDYAVRAAERETGLHAYEGAANQYERALTALEASEPVDESRRCELLIALGEAQSSSGTLLQFRQAFRQALDLARSLSSPERFARAALGLGAGMFSDTPGIVDEALVSALEEALGLLGTEESGLRARVMSRLASETRWHEESDRRESLCHEAIAMARRVGDRGALAWSLVISNFVFGSYDDPARRLAIAEEIVEVAQESGDKDAEFHGRSLRIVHLIALGDADGIDREIEILAGLADELRQPYTLGITAGIRACRALWQGDLAEARRRSWEGRGLRLNVERELANQIFNLQLYFLRRLQGRLAEALPAVRAGVPRFPTNPIWRCLLACACAETGNEREARRAFDALAADDFSALRDDVNPLFDLGLLADVCAALRDENRAALLHGRLLSYKGRYLPATSIVTAGSFARTLGLLAATMHRWDDAVRHFEEAIEVDEKMRARGWLPRTQCDYARMLLDRGGPGDRRRALDLLAEALETCQELGLKGWLDMCLELKLRAQGIDSGSVETSIEAVAASLGSKRPDLAPHAAPDGTVTLMFSDMEGFTAMTERLGDLEAREVIRVHNAIVRGELAAHGGYEVELQGDGFLLAFSSARDALRCATAIQRAFAAHSERNPERPIRVRIGLHRGEVLKDADRFFGRTVILAARIAGQADGGEILVSSHLKELTESTGALGFGAAREVKLKGISKTQRVHALEWE